MSDFTKPQIQAIESKAKNIVVAASAGSGKTTVMIARIVRLIEEGNSLENMLVSTFTKASALDMREKLKQQLAKKPKGALIKAALEFLPLADISTIDSICLNLIRNYFYFLDIDPLSEVLEATTAKSLLSLSVKEAIKAKIEQANPDFLEFYEVICPKRRVDPMVELLLNMHTIAFISKDPDGWLENCSGEVNADFLVELVRDSDKIYKEKKARINRLDFTDIERLTLKLLEIDEARKVILEKYKYIFVDEYQDINPLQDAIFSFFEGDKFIVGDIKQAIYRFRQSSPDIFMRHIENAKNDKNSSLIRLRDNFRSDYRNLRFCDRVFSLNMTKDFGGEDYKENSLFNPPMGHKKFDEPTKIVFIKAEEEKEVNEPTDIYSVLNHDFSKAKIKKQAQIQKIVEHIKGLVKKKIALGEITILLRSIGEESFSLLSALKEAGLKAVLLKEGELNRTAAVKAFVSYLRLLVNSNDDISLAAVLLSGLTASLTEDDLLEIRSTAADKRVSFFDACKNYIKVGDNKKILNALKALDKNLEVDRKVAATAHIGELCSYICSRLDYFNSILKKQSGVEQAEQLSAFLEVMSSFEKGVSVLEACERIEAGIKYSLLDDDDTIKITTIHSSKGLEYNFVILAFLEKEFNERDLSKSYILSETEGLALKDFNLIKNEKSNNEKFDRIVEEARRQNREEMLRLFYVALTRAKYQIAIFADFFSERTTAGIKNAIKALEYFPQKYKTHLAWLYASICFSKPSFLEFVSEKTVQVEKSQKPTVTTAAMQKPLALIEEKIPLKQTVTKLIRGNKPLAPFSLDSEPIEGSVSSSEVGNSYHKFFEVYDFSKNFGDNYLAFQKNYPPVFAFLNKEIAEKAAADIALLVSDKEFYRELAFIYRQENGSLLQGAIDLVVMQRDGSVQIFDYKTGRITKEQLAVYNEQLRYYKIAAENILRAKKVEASIYSVFEQKMYKAK